MGNKVTNKDSTYSYLASVLWVSIRIPTKALEPPTVAMVTVSSDIMYGPRFLPRRPNAIN